MAKLDEKLLAKLDADERLVLTAYTPLPKVCSTLNAQYGTGGNNMPLVFLLEERS